MLNLLEDYICRSLPGEGPFYTNPNLEKKVAKDGYFLPFRGNTVVFRLEKEEKTVLARLRGSLYAVAPDMLAQPLNEADFHMTLHDLANGPAGTPGLEAGMAAAAAGAGAWLRQWKGEGPLRMRGTWIFNMVNTSLVLGLEPADGESARRLEKMYACLEQVVPLGYAMTPHITLAYFRPGVYGTEQLDRLRTALRPAPVALELKMERLALQEFEDMDHYTDA